MLSKKDIDEVTQSFIECLKGYHPHPTPFPEIKIERSPSRDSIDIISLSDFQIGHLTPSYNVAVFNSRIEVLLKKILSAHTETRSRKAIVLLLGDIVHNERIGKTVNLNELEVTLSEQIFDVALPAMERLINAICLSYHSVEVHCVRGNHGAIDKVYSVTTNFDDIIYKFLGSLLRNTKAKFYFAHDFYKFVPVYNKQVLICHGDSIKPSGSTKVPFNPATTRIQNWLGSIGDFEAAFMGHFHSFGAVDFNRKMVFINGTVVTDDMWVLKHMGYTGSPCQTMVTVSKSGLFNEAVIRKLYLD